MKGKPVTFYIKQTDIEKRTHASKCY